MLVGVKPLRMWPIFLVLAVASGSPSALLERHFRDVRAALINGTSSVVPLAVLSELSRTALPELLGNDDAIYADLMRREAALSREHGLPHGHVACAPLSRARAARATLATALGRRVLYSSKTHDAVCWTAALTADDAEALRAEGFFFHVALLPGPAKLASSALLNPKRSTTLAVDGIVVSLERLHAGRHVRWARQLIDAWSTGGWGLRDVARFIESPPWTFTEIDTFLCQSAKVTVRGFAAHNVHLVVEAPHRCALAVLAFLSSQPQVHAVDFHSPARIQNDLAADALQSGQSGSTPLWDAGITGAGQYIQVCDTGVDDASCFFRDDGTASSLTGSYSSSAQVSRSTWSSPVTDLTQRKVVQYIAYPDTTDSATTYDSDGHGTHCAGSAAGSVVDDYVPSCCTDSDGSAADSYGDDCADWYDAYPSWCGSTDADDNDFSSNSMCCACGGGTSTSCSSSYTAPEIDEQGMAPDAKVMVYDFDDSAGALNVPDDCYERLFPPAYDAGARISSHSWGSTFGTYSNYARDFDEFMYDFDDMVVLVAASNDGSFGHESIGSPGTAKNVITVGALESDSLPITTVSYFSSRGSTLDGRLKPDVVAPGQYLSSAATSYSAGLATCATTNMAGTSMATPTVAGAVALLREFLAEGNHATYSAAGAAVSSYNASSPTAALVKAMLISSTAPVTYGYDASGGSITLSSFYATDCASVTECQDTDGSAEDSYGDDCSYYDSNRGDCAYGSWDDADFTAANMCCTCGGGDGEPCPVNGYLGTTGVDYHQGFGAVQLSNVLPLNGEFELFLFEGELEENQQWDYSFHVSSSGFDTTEIDVTLVWTDPPGSVSCSSSCLVHDLDLRVWEAGTQLYPNFGAATNGDYAGQADQANNVEKVSISSAVDGTSIDVSVLAGGLGSADTQKFALVVTGPLVTTAPSSGPTTAPPSAAPSAAPSPLPSAAPSAVPNPLPTTTTPPPSVLPSIAPTATPSLPPTPRPTTPSPSSVPVPSPTGVPSIVPTPTPTRLACLNGQQDNSETDVDCGGPECAPCEVSEVCVVASDCVSGAICLMNTCAWEPTALPSPVPSPGPTRTPLVVATLQLSGIACASYDQSVLFLALASIVANCSFVGDSDCTDVGVSSSLAVSVQTEIAVPLTLVDDGATALDYATASLTSAVSSGELETLIQAYAGRRLSMASVSVDGLTVDTHSPSPAPTMTPTAVPTLLPSSSPSALPMPSPTDNPVPAPTSVPVPVPTTDIPTPAPTSMPAPVPTALPFPRPSPHPSPRPTEAPTSFPTTSLPTATPTVDNGLFGLGVHLDDPIHLAVLALLVLIILMTCCCCALILREMLCPSRGGHVSATLVAAPGVPVAVSQSVTTLEGEEEARVRQALELSRRTGGTEEERLARALEISRVSAESDDARMQRALELSRAGSVELGVDVQVVPPGATVSQRGSVHVPVATSATRPPRSGVRAWQV